MGTAVGQTPPVSRRPTHSRRPNAAPTKRSRSLTTSGSPARSGRRRRRPAPLAPACRPRPVRGEASAMAEFQSFASILRSGAWAPFAALLEEPDAETLANLPETPKLEAEVAKLEAALEAEQAQIATARRESQMEWLN